MSIRITYDGENKMFRVVNDKNGFERTVGMEAFSGLSWRMQDAAKLAMTVPGEEYVIDSDDERDEKRKKAFCEMATRPRSLAEFVPWSGGRRV